MEEPMSAKQARERFIINEPVSGTVYTPAPAAAHPATPAPKEPLPPVYRPGAAPQRRELNPIWLILLWIVLIGVIVIGLGIWSPFATKPITMDASINGNPPPDKPLDTSAATALTIAVGGVANEAAPAAPTPADEATPTASVPIGVLVSDTLPWYIFSHHISGATFDEYNGALIELQSVPYQDLDIRGGADNKLCRIRTIYGSALVEVWVPCWELGKGGA